MVSLKRIKLKRREKCQCGCETVAAWSRLRPLRGPDLHSYFVLDECREDFEAELDARHKLGELFAGLRGTKFWQRWPYRKLAYALTYVATHRTLGEKRSRALARRQFWTFILPDWVSLMVSEMKRR